MEIVFYIGIGVLVLGYIWYASLIRKRNGAREALSGIDVQLRKRSNLVPNILTIAQRFMEHEKELMTEITALRSKVDADYDASDGDAVREHLSLAGELGGKMSRLLVTVEDYPELKSNETMVQAQSTYNEVEAQISAARRFYNSSVTALNNSVQIFPGNIIAGIAGVVEMPFYEADEASREPVNAADYLR